MITALIIGAGNRGQNYAEFSSFAPGKFKVIGVADSKQPNREKLTRLYNIPSENVFSDWKEVAQLDKFADVAIIATPDKDHKEPAVAFASKGYHLLLEKPMATTAEDCHAITEACKQNGVMLAVCHVLRYAPNARKIKELIRSGLIGEITNIQLMEPVGFWHFAHSYVRGNWRKESTSAFSLLAKSCHDIDLLQYWMEGKKCKRISSFGSLLHFTKSNKPQNAGMKCLECPMEEECAFSAKKIYLDTVKEGHTRWPNSVLTPGTVPDIENITEALKTGPYGLCVYECDNDVMSNQIVNMQFEGGATVSFSMVAFTEKICERQVTIAGTKGELSCSFNSQIEHYDFLTRRKHNYESDTTTPEALRGHGGADFYLMKNFVDAILTNDPSKILSGPDETLQSHLIVFEAERSRRENIVIEMD